MAYKTIKQNDNDWLFLDNFTLVPRANCVISPMCPVNMRLMIERAVVEGYLKIEAHVPDVDYTWEKLKS